MLLYGLRFLIYRSKKQQYYMLEMCYYTNLVLLTSVWLFPNTELLYKVQPPPLPCSSHHAAAWHSLKIHCHSPSRSVAHFPSMHCVRTFNGLLFQIHPYLFFRY